MSKVRFSSGHLFNNGAMLTVERVSRDTLSLRIQGEGETMLTDVEMGEYEALCLAHSILSTLTSGEKVR